MKIKIYCLYIAALPQLISFVISLFTWSLGLAKVCCRQEKVFGYEFHMKTVLLIFFPILIISSINTLAWIIFTSIVGSLGLIFAKGIVTLSSSVIISFYRLLWIRSLERPSFSTFAAAWFPHNIRESHFGCWILPYIINISCTLVVVWSSTFFEWPEEEETKTLPVLLCFLSSKNNESQVFYLSDEPLIHLILWNNGEMQDRVRLCDENESQMDLMITIIAPSLTAAALIVIPICTAIIRLLTLDWKTKNKY